MNRRLLAAALTLAAFHARADLQPGQWEISARAELPGAGTPQAIKQMHCLKREDADPSRLFGGGAGCTFLNKNDNGSVVTFDVACSAPVPARGTGTVRYTPQSLEGDLELRFEGFSTRSFISGRRVGDC
jgi:hypothetical protein